MENYIYFDAMKKDPTKAKMLDDGIKHRLVQHFDNGLLIKLRHIYFAGIPGSIFIFTSSSVSFNIGDKAQLMSHALEDEDFILVHGKVNSIANYRSNNEVQELKSNTWFEVNRDGRVWIYDMFSLMKFDKDLYYKLEDPVIERTITREELQSDPEHRWDRQKFRQILDPLTLPMLIPNMERAFKYSPYREYLKAEMTRFKKEIDYDKVTEEFDEDMRLRGFKK